VQTQLISAAVATVATVIFNYPKKISTASENICDAKKPAALDTSTGGRSSKAYDWSIQEIGKPGKGVKFVITIPMQ
jgi:hypothetical protein